MRIAYMHFLYQRGLEIGVYKKMRSQARACAQAGLPVDVHFFSHDPANSEPTDSGLVHHALSEEGGRAARLRDLCQAWFEVGRNYDAVILRAHHATPFFWRTFRRSPFFLVTEHHSKVLMEHRRNKQWLLWAMERSFGRSCLRLADGVVAVTSEIGDDVVRRGFGRPERVRVIANGVDVDSVPFTGFAPFDGRELRLCLTMSGLAVWNGFERMLDGMRAYSGPTAVTLHVAGKVPIGALEAGPVGPRGRVELHGVLDKAELDRVLGRCTLGVAFAAERLSWTVKMRQHVDFCQELLDAGKARRG